MTQIESRKRLPQKQKLALIEKQGGCCAVCGERLVSGLIEFDHTQDLQFDGDNAPDNWRALHARPWPCHADKTKRANAARAKCDRIRAGGRIRKGPPMAGSRDSKWKRKLNGETVRR